MKIQSISHDIYYAKTFRHQKPAVVSYSVFQARLREARKYNKLKNGEYDDTLV